MKRLLSAATFFMPILAFFLVIMQIIVSNELGLLGKDLAELETNINQEKIVKLATVIQIASDSSMLVQDARAKLLGFAEPARANLIVLDATLPVAFADFQK